MSKDKRKHIWPVSLAMSLALVGVLAAFVVLATANPNSAQAHGPCDLNTMPLPQFTECVAKGGDVAGHTHEEEEEETPAKAVVSSSTSGSSTVELKLTVEVPSGGVPVGGAIVLYLEDDFQEPDSISASDRVLRVHAVTRDDGQRFPGLRHPGPGDRNRRPLYAGQEGHRYPRVGARYVYHRHPDLPGRQRPHGR